MTRVPVALLQGLRSAFAPRMLALVLVPLLAALALWLLVDVLLWQRLVAAAEALIRYGEAAQWISSGLAHFLSQWIVAVVLLLLLWPLTQATALLVTSTVAMPIMLEAVAARDYPQLQRRRGGTVIGSIVNALLATSIYLLLWIVTLPLWLFGLPALLLPVLLNGWLNARLFRYDALAEHASAEEYRQFIAAQGGALWLLGGVVAVLQAVPLLNLFIPVYGGLVFIHFSLTRLTQMRRGAL